MYFNAKNALRPANSKKYKLLHRKTCYLNNEFPQVLLFKRVQVLQVEMIGHFDVSCVPFLIDLFLKFFAQPIDFLYFSFCKLFENFITQVVDVIRNFAGL